MSRRIGLRTIPVSMVAGGFKVTLAITQSSTSVSDMVFPNDTNYDLRDETSFVQGYSPRTISAIQVDTIGGEPNYCDYDDFLVQVGGAQQLGNPGFESGVFSPYWTYAGSISSSKDSIIAAAARSGNYGLRELASGNNGIRQTFASPIPISSIQDVNFYYRVSNTIVSPIFTAAFGSNPSLVVLNSVSYANGKIASLPKGTYSLNATITSNDFFNGWSSSGLISIANPSSQSTTVTVTGPGTITLTVGP